MTEDEADHLPAGAWSDLTGILLGRTGGNEKMILTSAGYKRNLKPGGRGYIILLPEAWCSVLNILYRP